MGLLENLGLDFFSPRSWGTKVTGMGDLRDRGDFDMDVHVEPNENDQWSAVDRAHNTVVGTATSQKDAEQLARTYLAENGGGNLTVHDQKGKAKGTVRVGD